MAEPPTQALSRRLIPRSTVLAEVVHIRSRRLRLKLVAGAAAAMLMSAAIIGFLFANLSKIEQSLPENGFDAVRSIHAALEDIALLRHMTFAAALAPSSEAGAAGLREAADIAYVRFVSFGQPQLATRSRTYRDIRDRVAQLIAEVDAIETAGLPLDSRRLQRTAARLEEAEAAMSAFYYRTGEAGMTALREAQSALRTINVTMVLVFGIMTTLAVAAVVLYVARRETMRELEFFAWRDPHTALWNRRWLMEKAPGWLARNDGFRGGFVLAIVDLDRFKAINDTYGHAVGDEVLHEVAETLLAFQDEGGFRAVRLGGDEFAVLIAGMSHGAAERIIGRLHAGLNRVVDLSEQSLSLGASIGVARSPEHGTSILSLLQHADHALYAAKRAHEEPARYALPAKPPAEALSIPSTVEVAPPL